MSVGNNNLSRILFKEYIDARGLQADGKRNVFIKDGRRTAFSITEDKPECRQFYEDCDELICYNVNNDEYYEYDRSDLLVSKVPSRISTSGLKAFNAVPWR